MEIKYNEEDRCPICGTKGIEYGVAEIVEDFVMYPCSCPSCNAHWDLTYKMVFETNENIIEG